MPVLLYLFWIILNGKVTPEILIIGVIVDLIVCWFVYGMMEQSVKVEAMVWKRIGKILVYLFKLILEVYWANLDVIQRVLGNQKQEPCLVFFTVPFKTNMARVALANSITLTPGTITCSMVGNYYCVHALDKELTDGIDDTDGGFIGDLLEIEEGL